jgi:hypothetical protein
MKRRTFLKRAAGAAVAAGAAPAILHATDKADNMNPILGFGDYRYECIHNWGELPKSLHWETTHGVCVDQEGLVYVKHQGHGGAVMDTVVVFDPAGKFVRSFGSEYYRGGHGIDVRKEGKEEFLYLSDIHNRQVVKTSLKGEEVWKLSFPRQAKVNDRPCYQKLDQYRPTNVAFAPDGGFYVADGYGSNFVHQYDKDAKYVRSWGGGGADPGKFQTPHGIWLDNRTGRQEAVVVADRANARLQYFTTGGKLLDKETVTDVLFPAHFDIRGDVLLVPDLHARVSLFNKRNEAIIHLGDDKQWTAEVKKLQIRNDPKKWLPGKFVHPHDACFDAKGNIFVVEWVPAGRVTLLKKV